MYINWIKFHKYRNEINLTLADNSQIQGCDILTFEPARVYKVDKSHLGKDEKIPRHNHKSFHNFWYVAFSGFPLTSWRALFPKQRLSTQTHRRIYCRHSLHGMWDANAVSCKLSSESPVEVQSRSKIQNPKSKFQNPKSKVQTGLERH